jgi:hypothetical protein
MTNTSLFFSHVPTTVFEKTDLRFPTFIRRLFLQQEKLKAHSFRFGRKYGMAVYYSTNEYNYTRFILNARRGLLGDDVV